MFPAPSPASLGFTSATTTCLKCGKPPNSGKSTSDKTTPPNMPFVALAPGRSPHYPTSYHGTRRGASRCSSRSELSDGQDSCNAQGGSTDGPRLLQRTVSPLGA